MKKNITKPESYYQYRSSRRKPLLHDFVTNLIASFGDITSLKKYAMAILAFLLILLMSGSYNLSAKDTINEAPNTSIVRIDSFDELNAHQKVDVFNALDQNNLLSTLNTSATGSSQFDTFPSAQRNVYLMNSAAQAFPYTIYLGGESSYNVEDIAIKHYGSTKVVNEILAANPNLDFSALKTGDRVYLPLINPDAVNVSKLDFDNGDAVSDINLISSDTASTEAPDYIETVEDEATEATEVYVEAEVETAAPVITETQALESHAVIEETPAEAPTTAAPIIEETTAAPTVAETIPPVSSYVVSASPETVDMYVRIVAAESSPSWPYEGHLMIAQTIINRAINGYWGDLYGVLTAANQYDVYSSGRYRNIHVTDEQRRAAMDALNGITAFDRDVLYFCTTYAYSPNSWWGTLDHRATHGNTMFFAP